MKIYFFRKVRLPIIRSLFTVRSAMLYVIQVCIQLLSSWVYYIEICYGARSHEPKSLYDFICGSINDTNYADLFWQTNIYFKMQKF